MRNIPLFLMVTFERQNLDKKWRIMLDIYGEIKGKICVQWRVVDIIEDNRVKRVICYFFLVIKCQFRMSLAKVSN